MNSLNRIQICTNHKTPTATCFGTGVPSSGSLQTQSITKSDPYDLYFIIS